MGRKLKVLMFAIVLLVAFFNGTVKAQNVVNKSFMAEQAKGKAPNVKVYLTGTDMSAKVKFSGNISEIDFVQDGDIEVFEESGEGIRYIILFDNSGSINIEQFEVTKTELSKMRRNLKNTDEMQLFTVGNTDIAADKTDVLGRVAKASEQDKLALDCEKIETIEYIPGKESRTILYRSLNEVLQEQASQAAMDKNRTVILLITDGEDDSDEVKGRNNDQGETLVNVKASAIPIYGILLNSTAREPNEEKIKFTKNQILNPDACHGYYYNCGDKGEAEIVTDAFETITKVIRNETYVVRLKAETNRISGGKSQLELAADNQSIAPVELDYSDYEEEKDAPVVVGIVEKKGQNTVSFTIEDESGINLNDAGDVIHYTISTKESHKSYTIQQVNVNNDGNRTNITLTLLETDFLNGEYQLVIDGIRDNSQDENVMKEVELSFSVEDGLDPAVAAGRETVQKYWWIVLVFVVVIFGIAGLILLRKKAVKVVTVDAKESKKADSQLIRLTITDRLGATREVEYNVEGSVFIGRSDMCEIFFDDDKLSKQHFVIEVTKMGCYIKDLDSTNKTFVNGVKVTAKRLLLDGDVITAGRETFIIHMEKMN